MKLELYPSKANTGNSRLGVLDRWQTQEHQAAVERQSNFHRLLAETSSKSITPDPNIWTPAVLRKILPGETHRSPRYEKPLPDYQYSEYRQPTLKDNLKSLWDEQVGTMGEFGRALIGVVEFVGGGLQYIPGANIVKNMFHSIGKDKSFFNIANKKNVKRAIQATS